MAHVFRIAQVKHEAETYLSQGLHQEAVAVYERFLANARDLDPIYKTAIIESIRRIKSDDRNQVPDEADLLSEVEITLIKKGWQSHATVDDRLASAQTLLDMGLYEYALEEYRQLLKKRYLTKSVMRGVALCLVNLVRPNRFSVVVDHFVREIFKHPRNRKALRLVIAKHIDTKKYRRHFSALCCHLSKVSLDPDDN
jgi:tetratricopeptide (TPR) repeat protein